jgi:hypothetical protein
MCLTSRSGCFSPITHYIGGWMGPITGLKAVERRKISGPCRESNPEFQTVARHYTDWAIIYINTGNSMWWVISKMVQRIAKVQLPVPPMLPGQSMGRGFTPTWHYTIVIAMLQEPSEYNSHSGVTNETREAMTQIPKNCRSHDLGCEGS